MDSAAQNAKHDAISHDFEAGIKDLSFVCAGGNPSLMGTAAKPKKGGFQKWSESVPTNPVSLPLAEKSDRS